MSSSAGLAAATIAASLLSGIAPAGAVEAPLSRASFERALSEGRACRKLDKAGSYVDRIVVDSVAGTVLQNLLDHLFMNDITQTFATVRLTTPYTVVRRKACEAKLFGTPLDEEELWRIAAASTTFAISVVMDAQVTRNDAETRENQEHYGVTPETLRTPGPPVESMTLRRDAGEDGFVLEAVAVEGGVDYVFPAAPLQVGEHWNILIKTPSRDVTLKLKRSLLRWP